MNLQVGCVGLFRTWFKVFKASGWGFQGLPCLGLMAHGLRFGGVPFWFKAFQKCLRDLVDLVGRSIKGKRIVSCSSYQYVSQG